MLKFSLSLLLAHPIYAQVGSADLILHVRLLESHRYSIRKKTAGAKLLSVSGRHQVYVLLKMEQMNVGHLQKWE